MRGSADFAHRSYGNLPYSDLISVIRHSEDSLIGLRNRSICLLGGTGFVGTWLVAALLEANSRLNLHLQISIITRDISQARRRLVLKDFSDIRFLQCDFSREIPTLEFQNDYFVHAATSSVPSTGSQDSEKVHRSSLNAAYFIINNAKHFGNLPHVIHASSGAVYGPQDLTVQCLSEDLPYGRAQDLSPYAKTKIDIERILSEAQDQNLITVQNPRLFAFLGPHIDTSAHFAVGNFVRDGLLGRKIRISGNAETARSYLYPTDLVNYLLGLFHFRGNQALNIGSSTSITMVQLASLVSQMTSGMGWEFAATRHDPSRYVPCTLRSHQLLGIEQLVDLETGLMRWINWLSKGD